MFLGKLDLIELVNSLEADFLFSSDITINFGSDKKILCLARAQLIFQQGVENEYLHFNDFLRAQI